MGKPKLHRTRASLLLAAAMVMAPLAACSDSDSGDGPTSAQETASESPGSEAPSETPGEPQEGTDAAESPGADAEGDAEVDCSGRTCSVTLSGEGAEAEILGTTVVLGRVDNGQASFRVGDEDLSCGEGDSTSAGPLTLECTGVTDDAVTMTASLG